MSGSAILDPDVLIDDLVTDVIDGLREDLHPIFGVRAYRVFTVLRTWTGARLGEGSIASDVEVEIRPQPRVKQWTGLDIDLAKCGLDELGPIKLTEWSLSCTEAEVRGPDLAANQQCMVKLTEAHDQGHRDKFFVIDRPPFVDREKDMGWVVWLRSVDV